MSERVKYRVLEGELKSYRKALSQAAQTIVEQNVSEYPIFVVHQQQMDMGIPMIDKDKVSGNWSVNASTLEEFVTKQIIKSDKIDAFKATFKPIEEAVCLFVLSELGASFIFLALAEDQKIQIEI